MTTLTPAYLLLFNVLGLKAICTSNRDIEFSFNTLNRQQIIQFLTMKINEGYKVFVPPFITKNKDYFRSRKSYIKILLNI
jgi:hypothetical protein